MYKSLKKLHKQFHLDLIENKGVKVIFVILCFLKNAPKIWKIPKHVQGGFKEKSFKNQTPPPNIFSNI